MSHANEDKQRYTSYVIEGSTTSGYDITESTPLTVATKANILAPTRRSHELLSPSCMVVLNNELYTATSSEYMSYM